MSGAWQALGPTPTGNTSHTRPLRDAIEHDVEDDSDCICGPTYELLVAADGSDAWLAIHHSLDGRERDERQ